jgi:uncharacterized repeat protein (TIGR01451 family)
MKLKLTKNSTIILTSVILVLSIALGYLVWRVNQEETTAPTESEAEGEGQTCSVGADCDVITCYYPYVSYCLNGVCTCKTVEDQQSLPYPCSDWSPRCTPASPGGNYVLCCTWDDCDDPDCQEDSPNTVESTCKTTCSSCNNPYFYQTRYKLVQASPICGDSIPGNTTGEECDPPGGPCTKDNKPGVCTSTCKCDLNPYCGDGTKDSGEECDPNANPTGCPTGYVCNSSCTCDAPPPSCGDGIKDTGEECDPSANPTGCSTGYTCNSSCTCNAPPPSCGDGVLDLDKGEECESYSDVIIDGGTCSWEECDHTTCKCLPGDLVLTKSVVESCVDEGTANPKSELVYTITLTNNGDGPARPDKIEDVLDSKILSSGVVPIMLSGDDESLVNRRGIYSEGKILWDFNDSMYGTIGMLPGSSFQTSYKVVISKENFGEYNNMATLTNLDNTILTATAKIDADCVASVPQTGIFDFTLGRISVGFVLILIGGVVYNLPSGIFMSKSNKNKFKYRVKFENNIYERRITRR